VHGEHHTTDTRRSQCRPPEAPHTVSGNRPPAAITPSCPRLPQPDVSP